uniref:Uncharacterized protein n=1 Tax=Rhizophora mucronata TaxID=61149 RepID=A0A2P2QFF4_RHIMU
MNPIQNVIITSFRNRTVKVPIIYLWWPKPAVLNWRFTSFWL